MKSIIFCLLAAFACFQTEAQTMTLNSPNAGATWQVGTSQTVSWSVSGDTSHISYFVVRLSINNGSSYTDISANLSAATRSFNYTPTSGQATTTAVCWVRAFNSSGTVLAGAISSGPFTIANPAPTMTLNSPNAGATWQVGTSQTVGWSASGDTSQISYFVVRLSTDNASSYTDISAHLSAGTRNFNYTPTSGQVTSTAVCWVRAFNSSGTALAGAISSGAFTIVAASTSALSITTTAFNPATATVGTGYAAQQAVTATGGQTPYSWSASGFPSGMAINSSTGAPYGTPTVSGTFNVTVTVTDSSSPQKTASKVLSISVVSGTTVSIPTVQTLAGTLVTVNSARLNGSVNPNGASTSAYFEYGTTTSYGSPTPTDNLGTTFQNINYTITGLSPNTPYHYRIVASNNNGINRGADVPFTTAAVPAQGSSVSGQVFNGNTGSSLSGVTVQLSGGSPTTTDANGNFSFASVAVNTYTLTASKTGYGTFTGTILVTAGSSPFQTIRLYPTVVTTSPPVVTSVGSQYSGALYFLDGISFPVTFTANVDWAGHTPSVVRFVTPKGGNFNKSTSGSTASQSIDVGNDFGPGGQLQVVAISSDGSQSVAKVANFVVMSAIPSVNLQVVDNGSGFSYHSVLATPNFEFLNDGLPPGVTFDSDIPLFGDNPFGLKYLPSLDTTVNGNNANYYLVVSSGDKSSLLSFDLAGQELDLTPQLNLTGNYDPNLAQWKWNGSLGVQGDVGVSKSWPFVVPTPLGPIPMFAKADLKLSADATLNILNIDPVTLNGTLELDPTLTGTLGVGLDDVADVAGWIKGQGEFTFQYPQTPSLQHYELQLSVGGTEYVHLWIINIGASQVWHTWTWPNSNPSLQTLNLFNSKQSILLQPYPRNYLSRPSYAAFNGRPSGGLHPLVPIPTSVENPLLYPLQTQIFPFSESSISANGTNCYAVWLYDNPSRSANNQTMLVFSKINGPQWNDPASVADDGTADFHPQLRTFADGSAVLAWENEGTVLSTNAALVDITTNLEIATAFYDPSAGAWKPMQQLTANNYLDRNPRIAGPSKNNLMLVWVANTNNDLEGSATNINKLLFSTWNGSAWSTPQTFASVPYPLLKYDLSYDGANAYVVMSVDFDNTLTNVNAHELFKVAYQNGSWGSLQQLTANQAPDDSPQMAIDPNGHIVLVWLQGNALSSVMDFNFANQQVVRTNEYSSNLGSFRLANSSDGRLAVIWAEPSQQYSSDLWGMFYDPIFEVWGSSKQLTTDSKTEMETAATFFSTNQLIALYDRVDIAVGNTNQIGSVITNADLYVLQYQFTNNLALVTNSLMVSPANPAPGDTVTLSVTAENLGDSAVSNVLVAFYQGDPANGGTEIGEASLLGTLAPDATANVEIGWTVPATTNPLPIYAVIDPHQQFSDSDLLNNEVSNTFVEPDLAVQSVTWSQITSNLLSVTATVINQGTIASQRR